MANSALIAIIASLSVISIYIALRFEWKFAVPVLIALMHDILITAGVYALVGREVTTSTVAALLTILGFSLYDTIIVFDRIRENVPRMPSAAFSQIVNRSMSEVIVRSLATSFCTVLPVLALFLFGGETLQGLRVRAAHRHALGRVLVGLHRRPGARALEGARAGLPDAPPPHPRGARATCRPTRSRRPGAGRRRARRSAVAPAPITAPQDPTQVSREEFDDMVRNLGIEDDAAEQGADRARPRPAGRRRAARARGHGRTGGDAPPRARPPGEGEQGRAGGGSDKPKKPRNRRHGRPR